MTQAGGQKKLIHKHFSTSWKVLKNATFNYIKIYDSKQFKTFFKKIKSKILFTELYKKD